MPTHPQRNHLIWLLWPLTIACTALVQLFRSLRNMSLIGSCPLFFPLAPLILCITHLKIVNGASSTELYFLNTFVEESVYSVTGASQPAIPFIIPAIQAVAPWYNEIWLICPDTPEPSNVIRASMLTARGTSPAGCLPPPYAFDGFLDEGRKVLDRRDAIFEASQEVVMLSRKAGSSTTKTSDGERRPR